MTEFTPFPAAIGGALIGSAAVLLLWLNGRIAGISGEQLLAVLRRLPERRGIFLDDLRPVMLEPRNAEYHCA